MDSSRGQNPHHSYPFAYQDGRSSLTGTAIGMSVQAVIGIVFDSFGVDLGVSRVYVSRVPVIETEF
jgi:hypothetical protein